MTEKNNTVSTNIIVKMFMGFATLCLVTALFMSNSSGVAKFDVPANGGTVGPFTVQKPHSVIKITTNQNLRTNGAWSSVSVELLDSQKKDVYGFGDDFFYETGRDSEGQWTESRNKFSSKLTIQKPGKYFLKIDTESNLGAQNSRNYNMTIKITQHKGSSIPHFIMGIFALIIGIIINEAKNKTLRNALENKSDDDDEVYTYG